MSSQRKLKLVVGSPVQQEPTYPVRAHSRGYKANQPAFGAPLSKKGKKQPQTDAFREPRNVLHVGALPAVPAERKAPHAQARRQGQARHAQRRMRELAGIDLRR